MSGERGPAHITVVEDNTPDVMLLGESLRAHGVAYRMTHYKDGEEAVKKMCDEPGGKAIPPDLIVLDLNMPRMGGLEVLKRLKRDEMLAAVPVVILTSSEARQERDDALRLGAERFLQKPVDLNEYLERVGAVLLEYLPEESSSKEIGT